METNTVFLAGYAAGLLTVVALVAAVIWWAIWEESRHKSTMQERDYRHG
jgi:TRAP-type C4-dicarboxylate transport system permease large subunit